MPLELDAGQENVVDIKVVGCGGAGNNVVSRMVRNSVRGVEFVAINTDKQALKVSDATHKLQIGEKLTGGKGAGSDPEIGRKSAEESRAQISKLLEGTDMVFITAGMGGGTGTGSAPIVADIAREMGILTVGVVTKPFAFEGKRRMEQAEGGIEELRARVDSLVIIPNERLKFVTEQKITFKNAFDIADDVLKQAVSSISDLIAETGFINLDFADVTAVMKDAGYAHMGVGRASGKARAEEAARMAVQSPLLETSINGAKGVIVSVCGSDEMALDEVDAAAAMVQEAVHRDANIIFGAAFDSSMGDEIRVTIIATGFEEGRPIYEDGSGFFTQARSEMPIPPSNVGYNPPSAPVAPPPRSVAPQPVARGSTAPMASAPVPTVPQPAPKAEDENDDEVIDMLFKIFDRKK